MKVGEVQLLVHADGIAYTSARMTYPGVELLKVNKADNPDYLFLDILISEDAEPGVFRIDFDRDEDTRFTYKYELKARKEGSAGRHGFGPEDVIYLIMPDRFANGNTENDDMPGMLEKSNRNDPDGRHGGDLKGITNHMEYFQMERPSST